MTGTSSDANATTTRASNDVKCNTKNQVHVVGMTPYSGERTEVLFAIAEDGEFYAPFWLPWGPECQPNAEALRMFAHHDFICRGIPFVKLGVVEKAFPEQDFGSIRRTLEKARQEFVAKEAA